MSFGKTGKIKAQMSVVETWGVTQETAISLKEPLSKSPNFVKLLKTSMHL